jgi:alcohol dehydrogenase YqhD (iron-dependent ADH family)
MLLPHQKKGSQLKPTDILPLVWDKQETQSKQDTAEDIQKVRDFWKQKDAQKQKLADGQSNN